MPVTYPQNSFLHKDSIRSRRYDVSHLFYGHNFQNGTTIQINSENGSAYGVKVTFFEDFGQQLSLFELEDDQHSRRSLAYLRLEYHGSRRLFDLDVFGDFLDGRRLRMLADAASTKTNANYITTKGFDYEVLATPVGFNHAHT